MIITVNGKPINVSTEEYQALFGTVINANSSLDTTNKCSSCNCENCPSPDCPVPPPPVNKMDELIEAVHEIADAISKKYKVTYHLEKEGESINLVGTDGTVSSVQDKDDNTTYFISNDGTSITLKGSDNSVQTITLPEDTNTKYSISFNPDNDNLTLTPEDGTESITVDLSKFANDTDIEDMPKESLEKDDLDTIFPDGGN
ncbi:MAG: hypothetical protein IJ193_08080 [Bacilli bacterium]|nr:hypothetical protein [Bacilli bacterium]